mgnify:FL=1
MSQNLSRTSVKDLEKNRLLGIIEGSAARVIFNLTSGAFLVGFLKDMGASDAMCGYILAIPVLAAVIQFLSPIILESVPYRKKLILAGVIFHRILLSAIIVIPLLPMGIEAKLWCTYMTFLISYLAFYFVNAAISNLYISFVPQNIRGSYFGKRESYILLTSTVVTLILGKILDRFNDSGNLLAGYMVTYAIVFIFTIVNNLSFFLMKEIPLDHSTVPMKVSEIFTRPIKDRLFVKYFVMLIIWNVSSQIANAYFSVYLKSDLKLSYTVITLLSMVHSLVYIFCARKWGRFADQKGWSATTMLTMGVLGICYLLWFFSSVGKAYIIVLLTAAHILSGVAWAGINIALFNMQFDYTPDEKRTVYIGFSSAASGAIGYMAAVLGSGLVGSFGSKKIVLLGSLFNIKQILFLVSALLLLACSLYIKFFMKPVKSI